MIPLLDIQDFSVDKVGFSTKLGDALHEFGFVKIRGFNVEASVFKQALNAWRDFVRQPQSEKDRYTQRGFETDVGYTRNLEYPQATGLMDIKEDFLVRARLPVDHPLTARLADCLTVSDIPAFSASVLALNEVFEEVFSLLVRPLSLYMGLREDWLEKHFREPLSLTRLLHYPAGGRAGRHLDANFVTIIKAPQSGLVVYANSGEEYEISSNEDEFIVNAGMEMGLLTNGFLRPTWHKVDAPVPREAMVHFVHQNQHFSLRPVGRFAGTPPHPRPDYFPPGEDFRISVRDFLQQQLGPIYPTT